MPEHESAGRSNDSAIRGRLRARQPAGILVPVLTVVCLLVLGLAWFEREQRYISADRGLGYWLGVAGLGLMVLLLLYPVRKRSSRMQKWGPIRIWFHTHMALGIAGPVLVLLHSNFELGSPNSSVALFSALLVSSSGYVGRFAYSRIHYGLSGRRAAYSEVRSDVQAMRATLTLAPKLDAAFQSVERWATGVDAGSGSALIRYFGVKRRLSRLRNAINRASGAPLPASTKQSLDAYLLATRRLARFRTYEQIFSLWHAVHLPLSFFLYTAAVFHVIAVHLY